MEIMAIIHITLGQLGYPYYGYGYSPFYYGGYGYPTQVVIVESGFHGPVYGKRSSRSTQLSGDNAAELLVRITDKLSRLALMKARH